MGNVRLIATSINVSALFVFFSIPLTTARNFLIRRRTHRRFFRTQTAVESLHSTGARTKRGRMSIAFCKQSADSTSQASQNPTSTSSDRPPSHKQWNQLFCSIYLPSVHLWKWFIAIVIIQMCWEPSLSITIIREWLQQRIRPQTMYTIHLSIENHPSTFNIYVLYIPIYIQYKHKLVGNPPLAPLAHNCTSWITE